LIHSSEVFHIFVKLLFHILCCLLYFIYLFFFRISLVSFWSLLNSFLSSFSCSCVFSSFLFVLSWYSLSCFYVFSLSFFSSSFMSISMRSSLSSSLRTSLQTSLDSLDVYHHSTGVSQWVFILFISH
jgi:hypothetical protein